jgi:hypothetical protein
MRKEQGRLKRPLQPCNERYVWDQNRAQTGGLNPCGVDNKNLPLTQGRRSFLAPTLIVLPKLFIDGEETAQSPRSQL